MPTDFEYWKTVTFHFGVQDPDIEGPTSMAAGTIPLRGLTPRLPSPQFSFCRFGFLKSPDEASIQFSGYHCSNSLARCAVS